MERTDIGVEVYQLRIWIRKISPQIWRRLLVRSDSTIAELHDTLQVAFGWSDEHLHRFLIRGKPYGIARIGGIIFDDNPRQVQLRDFHFRCKETWVYEYDLTDWCILSGKSCPSLRSFCLTTTMIWTITKMNSDAWPTGWRVPTLIGKLSIAA